MSEGAAQAQRKPLFAFLLLHVHVALPFSENFSTSSQAEEQEEKEERAGEAQLLEFALVTEWYAFRHHSCQPGPNIERACAMCRKTSILRWGRTAHCLDKMAKAHTTFEIHRRGKLQNTACC
jgi:hypothetical protein